MISHTESIFDTYNRYNKALKKYLLIDFYNKYIEYLTMKITPKPKRKQYPKKGMFQKGLFMNPRFNDHHQKRCKKSRR
jgi:hypothetical protein